MTKQQVKVKFFFCQNVILFLFFVFLQEKNIFLICGFFFLLCEIEGIVSFFFNLDFF